MATINLIDYVNDMYTESAREISKWDYDFTTTFAVLEAAIATDKYKRSKAFIEGSFYLDIDEDSFMEAEGGPNIFQKAGQGIGKVGNFLKGLKDKLLALLKEIRDHIVNMFSSSGRFKNFITHVTALTTKNHTGNVSIKIISFKKLGTLASRLLKYSDEDFTKTELANTANLEADESTTVKQAISDASGLLGEVNKLLAIIKQLEKEVSDTESKDELSRLRKRIASLKASVSKIISVANLNAKTITAGAAGRRVEKD
jgi:hypothetical protein